MNHTLQRSLIPCLHESGGGGDLGFVSALVLLGDGGLLCEELLMHQVLLLVDHAHSPRKQLLRLLAGISRGLYQSVDDRLVTATHTHIHTHIRGIGQSLMLSPDCHDNYDCMPTDLYA